MVPRSHMAHSSSSPHAPAPISCALRSTPRRSNHPVERTPHALPALVQHMRVDHGRADVRMPEEFLDRPDIVSRFEQVSRERMPQGMAARRLRDSRASNGVLHRPLHHGLVKMMPPVSAGPRIAVESRRRKHPLPAPFPRGPRILALDTVRQRHATEAPPQIAFMKPPHSLDVRRERPPERRRAASCAGPFRLFRSSR